MKGTIQKSRPEEMSSASLGEERETLTVKERGDLAGDKTRGETANASGYCSHPLRVTLSRV